MELHRPKPWLSFALVTQVVFWLVALVLVSYVSTSNYKAGHALPRAVLIFCCHLINFYACYSFIVPRYFEKGKRPLAVCWFIVLFALLTPLRYHIEHLFTIDPNSWNPRFVARRRVTGMLLLSEISIATVASLLRLAVSNEEKRLQMATLENLHLQTELRFLKAQMNPHFLFNTINNIYSLTLLKSDKASEALMKLSGLLRYMLYESSGKVSLEREVNALHAYVELYQLRFEKALAVNIINEAAQKDIQVESLLLIPLLENALKHSAAGIQPKATILMKLFMPAENKLVVHIHNTKADPPVHYEAGGIGLQNIEKRLQLVYPGQHEWMVDNQEHTFSVTLSLNIA